MTPKLKLKVGEFSKLNQVSVKTLRYYEEIGLLLPFYVDASSGYRYYDVSQIQIMNNIAFLKKLGFTLDEIKTLFNNNSQLPNSQMIKDKIAICNKEIIALKQRKKHLILLYKQLKISTPMENIKIKTLPAIIVASHRRIISSYQELFNLCPNIIGPEMIRLGCVCAEPGYCYTIDHNHEYKEANIDIEYCEAVVEKKQDSDLIKFKEIPAVEEAICYSHYGTYETFSKSWAIIYDFIEKNGYEIIDCPRFSYIDGIWNKENPSDWLTEIQVPVHK